MSHITEYIILTLIAISQVAVIYIQWNKAKKRKEKESEKTSVTKEYPYEGLRNMAISATPGAMLLSLPENEIGVYAVVMDWDMDDDVVSLIANITGDASLYVKSGGGIVGGGMYKNVIVAAQQFVAFAQTFIGNTTAATSTPLPDKNTVRFYLLTNKGKFTVQEQTKKLEDKSSEWTPLFDEGQKLIAELHKTVAVNMN